MKYIPIVFIIVVFIGCKNDEVENPIDFSVNDIPKTIDSISTSCDFLYDTIKNEAYFMHKTIMKRLHEKKVRGFKVNNLNDTLEFYLSDQDISAFAHQIDAKEKNEYKKLTNKVVFMVLEHEAEQLSYGLTLRKKASISELDYFMTHVANPTCNSLPIDSIIKLVETNMDEPHEKAKEMKQQIIEQLRKGNHTNDKKRNR